MPQVFRDPAERYFRENAMTKGQRQSLLISEIIGVLFFVGILIGFILLWNGLVAKELFIVCGVGFVLSSLWIKHYRRKVSGFYAPPSVDRRL